MRPMTKQELATLISQMIHHAQQDVLGVYGDDTEDPFGYERISVRDVDGNLIAITDSSGRRFIVAITIPRVGGTTND